MSELFTWFVGVTREFASGLGHHSTSVDAGRGGEAPNASPPSKDSKGVMPTDTLGRNQTAQISVTQASLKTSGLALLPPSVIHEVESGVQRVMDAHNYAGSGMSKARFNFEVAEGIRLRENEDGGEE